VFHPLQRAVRIALLCLISSLALPMQSALAQTDVTIHAVVPAGLLSAKKVFLSNAGSDSGLFPHPFSGTPDRPYAEFYDAIQKMSRFQLVADPAQADIVLEVRLTAPNGPQNPNKQKGASDPVPMVRLVIYDRPTHYVLWALSESIDTAFLQKSHDQNLNDAVAFLASDFAGLAANSPPPAH
jgi:hypothetical protein